MADVIAYDFNLDLIFALILLILLFISSILTFLIFKRSSVSIYVADKPTGVSRVCKIIQNECSRYSVVGFDAEWITRNKTRQPVALVQLCSPQGTCALIRLNVLQRIPEPLKLILENPTIVKVGVAPENDARYLLKDYGTNLNNTLDLRFLYPTKSSLARLSQDILGLTLNKNYKVRCSNWEAESLTQEQLHYAAMDAYAAVEIFKKWAGINKGRWKPQNWCDIEANLVELYNVPFKNMANGNFKSTNGKRTEQMREKNISEKLKLRFTTRKAKLYDNCLMKAPDGTLLCSTRKSKAEWYLRNGKAELVSEDPYVIRLLFEPKVKPAEGEHLYDKELKCDQCVVCGATKGLLKHNVVPRLYRKYFPLSEKSHKSHDVLVFCIGCHLNGDKYVINLMEKLNLAAGVTKFKADNFEGKIRKNDPSRFAKALLSNQNIPEDRRLAMTSEIKQFYNVEIVNDEFLRELLNEKHKEKSDQNENIDGKMVVDYFSKNRTIFELQRIWRQHFVDTMKPKFLPKHWSIDRQS